MSFYYPDNAYNKTVYDLDRSQIAPLDGAPSRQNEQKHTRHPTTWAGPENVTPKNDRFATGLCKCGPPCTEAFFCYWCQISRQYNMLLRETQGFHCGACCVLAWLDWCVCDIIGMAFQCYLRTRIRERYNMKEDCFTDCCVVYWCPCCALSQAHWEMAMRGDDPGATCTCGDADVNQVMR